MPMLKRQPFCRRPPPPDLKPDEEIFYLKLTNEIFRDFDEYFQRMILCNSLVWSCSLTGKLNLTFQEALDSEKSARKLLKGFPRELKKTIFCLTNLTNRGKILDVCEDVFAYARERYFKNEEVLAVIGNLWCRSKVLRVVPPSVQEISMYRREQAEKGELEKNDYLADDSWGPPPDLFKYEVMETEPDDPHSKELHLLEAIDVKREKTLLTRDKCRYLIKLSTFYNDELKVWRIRNEVVNAFGLNKYKFDDLFVGLPPKFEVTSGPSKLNNSIISTPGSSPSGKEANSAKKKSKDTPTGKKEGNKEKSRKSEDKKTPKNIKDSKGKRDKSTSKDGKRDKSVSKDGKRDKSVGKDGKRDKSVSKDGKVKKSDKGGKKSATTPISNAKKPKQEPKPKKPKVEKQLTPQELKQLELQRKAKEREQLKEQKKIMADFKKLWFKPKEDLEVEDLKDLPSPDPVCCKIPNNLFGEFVMIVEYFNCYSSVLKTRDSFSSGLTFDILERALTKNEVAGPFNDIIQLLLKAVFRLQETENAEITQEKTAAAELDVDDTGADVSAGEAIKQATAAATWSLMYQNTSLNRLNLDHFSVTEILRLHLLASGANPSEKDVKWRWQNRGCYVSNDDPGLQLRMEEPQILKTLSHGTIFDLTMTEKIKIILCLINQVLTYVSVRDTMDENFETFRQARASLRALQASERKLDNEDNFWKQKLKTERMVPDPNFMKNVEPTNAGDGKLVKADAKTAKLEVKPKGDLTDEEIETHLAKREKEITKRKQMEQIKIEELTDLINKSERKLGMHPIGRDRAYRRYWIFPSIHGLFVEHDDEQVGTCLAAPTPYLPDVNLQDMNFIKENYEKLKQMDKEGSDKENSTLATPKKVSKKKLASVKKEAAALHPSVFGVCTGDAKSCPVHCTYLPRPKWSFFWNTEHLDALIEGLSPRGIREKDLRQCLIEEKEGLSKLISKCPVMKLNTEITYPESVLAMAERRPQRSGQSGSARNHLDPRLNFPLDTPLDKVLELSLRDVILELEDKIFLGSLGSLKVNDRSEWRIALESQAFNGQTESLIYGGNRSYTLTSGSGRISGRSTPSEPGTSKRDSQNKSTNEDAASSSGSNESDRQSRDDGYIQPSIKDLACAILQLRQSVEPKFFKRPLGNESQEDKKKRTTGKASEMETVIKCNWLQGTPLERWELSLMASTSFSQLFMHLFTLESSIQWSRSVLNARCRLCRRKGDPEKMLLCDGCNKGHHAYCLKPPLQIIPKGDWFCTDCKPEELPPKLTPRNRKHYLSDEAIAEELGFSEDDDGEEEEDEADYDSSRSRADVEEVCHVCNMDGDVLMCDKCPLLYHLQCLDPPKTRVPRGTWFCPECTDPKKGKKRKFKKSHKKSKSNSSKTSGEKAKASKRKRIISSDETDDEEEEDNIDYNDDTLETVGDESANNSEEDEENDDEDNEDEEHGNNKDSENDSEEEQFVPVVKMKFGSRRRSPIPSGGSTRLSRQRNKDSGSDEEEEEALGRGGKRRSAYKAAEKIAQASKRLRSDSKENESSENSNDSTNCRKRSFDSSDSGSAGMDCPKRTRLQRMNTNNRVGNMDLDNVLLDRLLQDVMKQTDAWPFLKPVKRSDAPDYHDMIKNPMDLGTIKYKLNSMVYTCNQELISDLHLVFTNCMEYNDPDSNIYICGVKLTAFCEKKCSKLGIHFSESSST